jgi:hypothetical protein
MCPPQDLMVTINLEPHLGLLHQFIPCANSSDMMVGGSSTNTRNDLIHPYPPLTIFSACSYDGLDIDLTTHISPGSQSNDTCSFSYYTLHLLYNEGSFKYFRRLLPFFLSLDSGSSALTGAIPPKIMTSLLRKVVFSSLGFHFGRKPHPPLNFSS